MNFALGNIQNHFDGVGGPDNVTIALVVLGPALKSFARASANPDITARVGKFTKAGLQLAACGNTMKAQDVTLDGLLPGFTIADRGGVVRIAELQSQGLCVYSALECIPATVETRHASRRDAKQSSLFSAVRRLDCRVKLRLLT